MRNAALAATLFVLLSGCAAPPDPSPTRGPSSDSPLSPIPSTPGPGGSQEPFHPQENGLEGCSGSGPVTFSNSPMRDEDFPFILPYGLLVGGHVTPIDHMYFAPPDGSQRDAFEVRAIADGVIYSLQPRDTNVEANRPKLREWRMDIAHTCTFTSYFDLITKLEPSLEAQWNASRAAGGWRPLPVQAGQLVGWIGAQTLDFGVYDYNVTLPGFVVPDHYQEPWKIHTVDPFPHFAEPVRSMLLGKLLRQAEPRAGKIDYDVDGRLVGNWFAVGSGGYGDGGQRWDYWEGHFSFVYDAIDPTHLRFSMGNWSGAPAQFSIVGNTPDPATVGVESGRVKLELAQTMYAARNRADASGFGGEGAFRPGDEIFATAAMGIQGVALLEMTEPRLLKLEVFPGKTAAEVADFTAAARMYER